MVDFHTHILPDVDDGAKNIEESIQLIKEAQEVGFETLILTSHYLEEYYEVNVKERIKKLKLIQSKLNDNELDLKLILGNEIYISNSIVELIKEQKACTINNTKYVLFELPFNIKPANLYDVIYKLLQNGCVPILAHPERYHFVQQNPEVINDLIEKGVLMQSNFGSFIGQYGKRAKIIANKFLKNDMIHFLGTDVHRAHAIYNKIPEIILKLEKIIGKEKLEQITKINPQLVLENKEIEVKLVKKIKLTFFENIIMKMKG